MFSTLKRKLPRPFANVHWALPFCVILLWELLLTPFFSPCGEVPYQLEIVLITSTVWVALWVSSLRVQHQSGWRKAALTMVGAAYDLLLLLVIFILVSIPIAFFSPIYECSTPRTKVSVLILGASVQRAAIDERFASQKTLKDIGKGLEIVPQGNLKAGFITSDGVIVAVGEDPPAVVMLTPTVSQSSITWKCLVLPVKVAPGSCR